MNQDLEARLETMENLIRSNHEAIFERISELDIRLDFFEKCIAELTSERLSLKDDIGSIKKNLGL